MIVHKKKKKIRERNRLLFVSAFSFFVVLEDWGFIWTSWVKWRLRHTVLGVTPGTCISRPVMWCDDVFARQCCVRSLLDVWPHHRKVMAFWEPCLQSHIDERRCLAASSYWEQLGKVGPDVLACPKDCTDLQKCFFVPNLYSLENIAIVYN